MSLSPALDGHGFGLLRYDLDGLPRGSHLAIELNSDTLRLSYDRLRFGRGEVGVNATGEALIAGLLDEYYRDGRNEPGRGFYASYAALGGYAKLDAAPHFLELAVTARRWLFQRNGSTDGDLSLPPEAWVGELRLRYTLWLLDGDRQAQRLHPRVRGVAFGVELGLDQRSEARRWGAPDETRNDPARSIYSVRQWLRAGVKVHARVRFQLDEVACWMSGEDDLVRLRVGGLNPYSVPLAGAPWAGYLAGKVAATDATLHVRAWREHEVGVLLDTVVLDDADRAGALGRAAVLAGVGVFADLRWRAWQLDLRGGWSPTLRPNSIAGGWGMFAALGWGWSR